MALAMPVNNTFDPFCWLQSQMFTDSSSQDEQEMDFCDDNNNHIGDYTPSSYQNNSTVSFLCFHNWSWPTFNSSIYYFQLLHCVYAIYGLRVFKSFKIN